MTTYLLLLRGVNVGGKNNVPMADLRRCLEELGFTDVSTYGASGNVIVTSDKSSQEVKAIVETALPKRFQLDSALIKVLVLTRPQLRAIVDNKPQAFGDEPEVYYSDVLFLIDVATDDAIKIFNPREGVDTIWRGNGVIYSQRLGAQRTKSRLSAIVGTPLYKSITIRSWNTTITLIERMNALRPTANDP